MPREDTSSAFAKNISGAPSPNGEQPLSELADLEMDGKSSRLIRVFLPILVAQIAPRKRVLGLRLQKCFVVCAGITA